MSVQLRMHRVMGLVCRQALTSVLGLGLGLHRGIRRIQLALPVLEIVSR